MFCAEQARFYRSCQSLLAYAGGENRGVKVEREYGKIYINKISGFWCLEYLYVNPGQRGNGYAKALVEEALRKCGNRPIYLFASAEFGSNYNRLCKFYKQFGFVKEKQEKNSAVPFNYNMVLWG